MLSAREPIEHELKCWPEYYDAVECGDKPFEIRKWDRPYRVGDTLLLRRYDPTAQDYTGQQMRRKITYLLDLTYLPSDNIPHFAGYVAIGLDDPRLEQAQRRADAAVKDLTKLATKPITPCHSCAKTCVFPASLAPECQPPTWCRDWQWRDLEYAPTETVEEGAENERV